MKTSLFVGLGRVRHCIPWVMPVPHSGVEVKPDIKIGMRTSSCNVPELQGRLSLAIILSWY
jgi:hypothetical protein